MSCSYGPDDVAFTTPSHGTLHSHFITAGVLPAGPRVRKQWRTIPAMSMGSCRVLLLGGSGRVGYETAGALSRFVDENIALHVTISGRNEKRAHRIAAGLNRATASAVDRRSNVHFSAASVDILDDEGLTQAAAAHDVVVHTAGPFQGRTGTVASGVLRAATRAGAWYVDVCDDSAFAAALVKEEATVRREGCVAIVSAGIYPGVSNLLACRAADLLRKDGDDVRELRLYYHTAGSGGIGATVLASTFLLLGEQAVSYDDNGNRLSAPSASALEVFDFGGLVGCRTTYALRLPEIDSLHSYVAPRAAVTGKFSTAPPLWNWLLVGMARAVPSAFLANRDATFALARFSIPVVRAVDIFSGARTVVAVRAVGRTQRSVTIIFDHKRLAQCVGEATAGFVAQLVHARVSGDGRFKCGLWFPEQLPSQVRDSIITDSTKTCDRLETLTSP